MPVAVRSPRRLERDWPVVALVVALAVLGAAGLSSALSRVSGLDSLEAKARAIARELTCPVCSGQSVAESNSVVAAQMRAEIARMLQEGRTEDEILSHYVDLYGPWILARPPASGAYVLLWGTPAAVLLAGGILAFRRRVPSGARVRPAPRGKAG